VFAAPHGLVQRHLVDEKVLRPKTNRSAHAGDITGEVARRSDVGSKVRHEGA
jgi:hypothetical protein